MGLAQRSFGLKNALDNLPRCTIIDVLIAFLGSEEVILEIERRKIPLILGFSSIKVVIFV